MKSVHLAGGVLVLAATALAGALGAWQWWRIGNGSPLFWRVLRAAQGLLVLEAALGGIRVLQGAKAAGLHLTYGLVPIAVSFVAEQLRIASAEMVLDARGLDGSADLARLAQHEQIDLARAILRRELGVMTLALLVNLVLLVRAAGTS